MRILQIALFCLLLSLPFSMAAYGQEAIAPELKSLADSYKLGSGDKIKMTVFGEEDLSGQFDVDGSGYVSLPIIGSLQVAGMDSRQVENKIADSLRGDYLINPRVTVEVLNFRPFFILGEVNKPGSYPYVNGLTVVNAIALAGGYTYRAKTSEVVIIREKDGKKIEIRSKDNAPVYAGDTVRVLERLF